MRKTNLLHGWFGMALALSLPGFGNHSRAWAAEQSKELRTVTERLDWDILKRHDYFGYTEQEIHKWFDVSQVFNYDFTGLAKERVKAPPVSGVHPRVLFGPDDLPELQRRLATVKPAKLQMDGIRLMLQKDLTGAKARFGQLYQVAIRGEPNTNLLKVEVACPIIYEAFRCLVDEDATGGKKAAAALATLAQLDRAALEQSFAKADQKSGPKPLRDFQQTMGLTQCGLLGLGYDFAYNWMTEAQRDTVCETIAKASAGMTLLGCETIPALPANVSNWIPMHMRLIFLVCAIEGEKGYDPATYRRCVEGYKRYLTIALFPAGDMYESMGKGFLCAENLVPVAKRGDNLLALQTVRTQVAGYYLHAMDPWGGHFTYYDSLGGRGNNTPMYDVTVLKYLFPKDPGIDFVFRNSVGDAYDTFKEPVRFGHFFHLGDGLIRAIFAQEYDESKTWAQAQALATTGKPLTFFSDDTGNLITRDRWDTNAVQLHFLTRSVSGGHQYADRGHFSLHALGRYWAIYKPLRQVEQHYEPQNRSVLLIDGKGPGMSMGRCAALQDNAEATFIVADFKTTYAWDTGGNNRFPKGGERVPFNGNYFRLHKSPKPWMEMPWSDLPNWQTSLKGSELWLPHIPVQRAFRTAGLVRGKHPYVLIVDDFQKDTAPHDYTWNLILEDDLVRTSAAENTSGAMPEDVIIGEKDKTGAEARYLLVRILDADGYDPKTQTVVGTYALPNPPNRDIMMNHLTLSARSVAPRFKVLLFPYRQGQELPKTQWNSERTRLQVAWSDQQDELSSVSANEGRTAIQGTRNGQVFLSIQ